MHKSISATVIRLLSTKSSTGQLAGCLAAEMYCMDVLVCLVLTALRQ